MSDRNRKRLSPKSPEPMRTGFTIRKVITEQVPVDFSASGAFTVGGFIDGYLADSIKAGEEVQFVGLEITSEDWDTIKQHYGKDHQ